MSLPLDDDLFATLVASPVRLLVVECLADRGSPIGLDDLAAAVARQLDDTETHRVEVALHHVHLSRLVRLGLIDYDTTTLTVDGVDAEAVEAALERATALSTTLGTDPLAASDALIVDSSHAPASGGDVGERGTVPEPEGDTLPTDGHVEAPPPHGSGGDGASRPQ